jgi:saccharopine dehydrogenase-like NADP-dependent oxidoreductase
MKDILILGAGKSASVLIEYLIEEAPFNHWHIHVADASPEIAAGKTGGSDRASAYGINLQNIDQLNQLIDIADLVISMLPPHLHNMVARSCLEHKKHFINASYLTPEIMAMDKEARDFDLSFICEMGLDPGIDHMSAMEMIHSIKDAGGMINSFRSHCGGLISPESDDNPWHYKISWNPRNIVMAGRDGAAFLENKQVTHTSYAALFDPERKVHIPLHGDYAWYPNRDSLAYIDKYDLREASTFVRTTLRHPDFCLGWKEIVALKLTDESISYDTTDMNIRSFLDAHCMSHHLPPIDISKMNAIVSSQFAYLGFDSIEKINRGDCTAADILQWIAEKKLGLQPGDRDMIIMLHEIGYTLNGRSETRNSHLVVKGTDPVHTAMAKTVGLPLAFAAKHILNGNIRRKGVFIPIYPDVYSVILPELKNQDIVFFE